MCIPARCSSLLGVTVLLGFQGSVLLWAGAERVDSGEAASSAESLGWRGLGWLAFALRCIMLRAQRCLCCAARQSPVPVHMLIQQLRMLTWPPIHVNLENVGPGATNTAGHCGGISFYFDGAPALIV